MARIIHLESEIVVGKLYKSLNKGFYDTVLYLGCGKHNNSAKCLVVVMDESCGLVGNIVQSRYSDDPKTLWVVGFEEQEG